MTDGDPKSVTGFATFTFIPQNQTPGSVSFIPVVSDLRQFPNSTDVSAKDREPEQTSAPKHRKRTSKDDTPHLRTQSEREKCHLKKRLSGFDWKQSRAWHEITRHFGSGLSQDELLAIAEILATAVGLRTDRAARRRKEVLIKWFEENLSVLEPLFPRVELYNGDDRLNLVDTSVSDYSQ